MTGPNGPRGRVGGRPSRSMVHRSYYLSPGQAERLKELAAKLGVPGGASGLLRQIVDDGLRRLVDGGSS